MSTLDVLNSCADQSGYGTGCADDVSTPPYPRAAFHPPQSYPVALAQDICMRDAFDRIPLTMSMIDFEMWN
ncbi:unnamed protein product [Arctia plantaginis]|uniref:Uncharacterized protein n=1 Tax=Arctia plantaginis TaxID=874455 RepID=A0A8S0YL81_ARCPL|nr:unnamed protein product [Arctia plantaginis]